MKGGKVSQQRIARNLGVSQALVSLVLNGKRENISEETYQRIWRYATEVGYRPKGMQLDNRRAGTTSVGFVLRSGLRLHTQSNFFSHVQHGLHTVLTERGYDTVFLGAEDHLSIQSLKSKLKRDNLFGLVVMGEVDEQFLRAIKTVQQNIVAVSATYPGLCHSVMPNDRMSLELLVAHLVELGHEEFAWVGGNKTLRQNFARRNALVEALKERGLSLADQCAVDVAAGDRLDGRKVTEMILESVSRDRFPTAWVCHNGLMARGVINCLMQKGWHVPEQISVVAVDATRVCVEEHPEITGASANPEKMGTKSGELLLQAAEQPDEALTDLILQAELTVRETSAKAAAESLIQAGFK